MAFQCFSTSRNNGKTTGDSTDYESATEDEFIYIQSYDPTRDRFRKKSSTLSAPATDKHSRAAADHTNNHLSSTTTKRTTLYNNSAATALFQTQPMQLHRRRVFCNDDCIYLNNDHHHHRIVDHQKSALFCSSSFVAAAPTTADQQKESSFLVFDNDDDEDDVGGDGNCAAEQQPTTMTTPFQQQYFAVVNSNNNNNNNRDRQFYTLHPCHQRRMNYCGANYAAELGGRDLQCGGVPVAAVQPRHCKTIYKRCSSARDNHSAAGATTIAYNFNGALFNNNNLNSDFGARLRPPGRSIANPANNNKCGSQSLRACTLIRRVLTFQFCPLCVVSINSPARAHAHIPSLSVLFRGALYKFCGAKTKQKFVFSSFLMLSS